MARFCRFLSINNSSRENRVAFFCLEAVDPAFFELWIEEPSLSLVPWIFKVRFLDAWAAIKY